LCFITIGFEDKDMGCCGSCGGEAPNHINNQDQDKNKDNEKSKKEEASQSQDRDKEKK
jgi:hypothetical protein